LPHHLFPVNSLPAPLKAIARGFLVLFHIGIGSPSTIYHHLNLLPSPSPHPQVPPYTHTHTLPILQSWFLLHIFKLMFKAVSQCMPTVSIFYFTFNLPITLPFPFTSHPLFFSSFQYTSLHPLPSHLMLCDITDALSFSFLFPLSPSSLD
jgi:hypothetical protein